MKYYKKSTAHCCTPVKMPKLKASSKPHGSSEGERKYGVAKARTAPKHGRKGA